VREMGINFAVFENQEAFNMIKQLSHFKYFNASKELFSIHTFFVAES
jgi:hypothetical protein